MQIVSSASVVVFYCPPQSRERTSGQKWRHSRDAFMSSVVSDAPPPVFHFVLWMDYIWSRCVLLFSLSNWTCWETGRPLLIYCTTIKRLFSKTHLQHWCPPQWNESLSGLLQFEAHPRQTKNRRGRQLEEIIMTHVDICCVLNFASTMLVYKPLFLAL